MNRRQQEVIEYLHNEKAFVKCRVAELCYLILVPCVDDGFVGLTERVAGEEPGAAVFDPQRDRSGDVILDLLAAVMKVVNESL